MRWSRPANKRLLVPAERGSSGLPGTAKTSLPCSPANRAVIREPERSAASTTTTPSAQFQPVAARKILGARREAGGALADEETPLADGALQLLVLGRVDNVDAAGEHSDSPPLKRGKMGCGIDTAGKTRGDDETFDSEVCGEAPGEFLSSAEPLRAPTMDTIGMSARSSLPLA
jgi:hypothetical protein